MDICPRCGVAMVAEFMEGQGVSLCRNPQCEQYRLDTPKRAEIARRQNELKEVKADG